jgi:hypothetical protein
MRAPNSAAASRTMLDDAAVARPDLLGCLDRGLVGQYIGPPLCRIEMGETQRRDALQPKERRRRRRPRLDLRGSNTGRRAAANGQAVQGDGRLWGLSLRVGAVIKFIKNRARTLVYSTALPPAIVAAAYRGARHYRRRPRIDGHAARQGESLHPPRRAPRGGEPDRPGDRRDSRARAGGGRPRRLPLLPTPPHGDAVTVGYRPVGLPEEDLHLPEWTHLRAPRRGLTPRQLLTQAKAHDPIVLPTGAPVRDRSERPSAIIGIRTR